MSIIITTIVIAAFVLFGGLLFRRRDAGKATAVVDDVSKTNTRESGTVQQDNDSEIVADALRREIAVRKEMEARLLVAMDVAESASAAKSEFLANVSHELRTPMTAIIASTQLLLEFEQNTHQKEILDIITRSSNSMVALINNLLDFARTEAGKIKLDETEFKFRENIVHALKPFALRAEKKGLRFSYDVDPSIPEILVGDFNRLQQVLNNLVDNALKFTSKGEIECFVRLDNRQAPVEREGERVCVHFTVRDTGIGISEEKKDMIFDAFTQADGSTTREYGGTGLGLTISRQLAEMMDGRIWVESEEGKGSVFHFVAFLKKTSVSDPLEKSSEKSENLKT